MITYAYLAQDPAAGKKVRGEIEADNERSAAQILIQKGLTPLDLKAKSHLSISNFRHRVSTKQRVIFSRQLSTLIGSGLPLVQSLRAVQSQTSNIVLKDVIGKI